jgi:heme-degrading monooxygenase HmoA
MKHALSLLVAMLLFAGCSTTRNPEGNAQGETMSTKQPRIMLVVGGLKSDLPKEELERRYKERMPEFRDVPGLAQKYYSYDEDSQEWAGIYLWESEEALAAYLKSDLKESIAKAYELTAPPKIQRIPIVDVLRQ